MKSTQTLKHDFERCKKEIEDVRFQHRSFIANKPLFSADDWLAPLQLKADNAHEGNEENRNEVNDDVEMSSRNERKKKVIESDRSTTTGATSSLSTLDEEEINKNNATLSIFSNNNQQKQQPPHLSRVANIENSINCNPHHVPDTPNFGSEMTWRHRDIIGQFNESINNKSSFDIHKSKGQVESAMQKRKSNGNVEQSKMELEALRKQLAVSGVLIL